MRIIAGKDSFSWDQAVPWGLLSCTIPSCSIRGFSGSWEWGSSRRKTLQQHKQQGWAQVWHQRHRECPADTHSYCSALKLLPRLQLWVWLGWAEPFLDINLDMFLDINLDIFLDVSMGWPWLNQDTEGKKNLSKPWPHLLWRWQCRGWKGKFNILPFLIFWVFFPLQEQSLAKSLELQKPRS